MKGIRWNKDFLEIIECIVVATLAWKEAIYTYLTPLQWRHDMRDGVSNHQPHDCLLMRFFRRRSKKTSKFRVTDLCAGIHHRWAVNSPHKGPVTPKMVPFDDVIMQLLIWIFIALGNGLSIAGCHTITWTKDQTFPWYKFHRNFSQDKTCLSKNILENVNHFVLV